jgi:hypothetical protein
VSVSRDLLQDAARDMRDIVGGDRDQKAVKDAPPFAQVPIFDLKRLPRDRPWAEAPRGAASAARLARMARLSIMRAGP